MNLAELLFGRRPASRRAPSSATAQALYEALTLSTYHLQNIADDDRKRGVERADQLAAQIELNTKALIAAENDGLPLPEARQ